MEGHDMKGMRGMERYRGLVEMPYQRNGGENYRSKYGKKSD